jgi:hypothetical protein
MAIAAAALKAHRPALSITYGVGMFFLFVGQRILTVGALAWAMTALGCLCVFAATGLRFLRLRGAHTGERTGQRALLLLYAMGSVALLAYLLTSELSMLTFGTSLDRHAPAVNSALRTLWPALWLIGTLPIVFVEMAYASMRRAPVFEQGRLTTSLLSGLGMAFALVFAFATVYAANLDDTRYDLSYFRTARPGESTQKIVTSLDRPLTITTFFPPTSDVGQEVDGYMSELKGKSPLLKVEQLDHALDPGRGRELGATGNGVIIFTRGSMTRQIALPLETERARAALRTLDESVNSTLMNVTRPARRVYFTQGHGERVFTPVNDTDRRSILSGIKQNLTDQGIEVLEFSIAHGLGADVPSDALAVMVVGPQQPFLPEEVTSLERYVKDQGGSLMVALDPEAGLDFAALVNPFGVTFSPYTLANDVAHWRRTGQPSDRTNIATVGFGSHISIATLAKLGFQAPVVFMGAGNLMIVDDAKPAPEVTVQTDANTWADMNLDFEANQTETRKAFAIAVAASFDKGNNQAVGRMLAFADADAFADIAMQNPGNKSLFEDAMRWLGRDEAVAGMVKSEEDVPITHSRKQDLAWFYLTSFVPPVVFVLMGLLITRRRRAERARDEHLKAAAQVDTGIEVEHKEAV